MRKALLSATLILASVTATVVGASPLAGCNNVPAAVVTNAVAAAQAAAQTATTLISDAQAAWPTVKALLPPDKQAAAQDAFDKAVFTANHALLALNDAITGAIAANNSTFDFTSFLSALGDAAMQVIAILQQFRAMPAAPAAPSLVAAPHVPKELDAALADMSRAVLTLKSSKTAPASSK